MNSNVSKQDLAEIVGVSVETVDSWMRKGIPRQKKGRTVTFNLAHAAEWFGTRKAMAKYVYKIHELIKPAPPDVATPEAGDTEVEIKNALARARMVERQAYDLVESMTGGDMPGMLQGAQEHYLKCADNLRKLEKDWSQIQLSQGEVVSRSDVDRRFAQTAILIKTRMQAIPSSVAGRCEGLPAAEIAALLTGEIESALTELADKA